MRHHDLGALDAPVLLFGGPYSNMQATQAVLDVARHNGFAPRNVICTGDVVAYCANPAETVAVVRAFGCTVVAGNCEVQLANNAPDCGCGFETGTACDLLSAGWFPFASTRIGDADRAWMRNLPDLVTFDHKGARYGVMHGGVSDVSRFIWPSCPHDILLSEWALFEKIAGPVDHIVAGHSGIPFVTDTDKGRWINAGVIGMPPHDGQAHTRYVVLENGKARVEVLAYDAQAAQDAMQQAGLTQGYDASLTSGFWPSEDILPAGLRRPSCASG